MSDSIVLYLTLLGATNLFFILPIILFSNNLLCSEVENNPNSLFPCEQLQNELIRILSDEESQLIAIKNLVKPIIKTKIFCKFKNLMEKANKSSEKISDGLKNYVFFQKDSLKKLDMLILKSFYSESDGSKDSLSFYNDIDSWLNDFDALLNGKKSFEDKIGEYPKSIVNLLSNFKKKCKLLPVIRKLFSVEKFNPYVEIFKNFNDCIYSLERRIKKMMKHYDFFLTWMKCNSILYVEVKKIFKKLQSNNKFLLEKSKDTNLVDKVTTHRRNLKIFIQKLFSSYFKCIKDEFDNLSNFFKAFSVFVKKCGLFNSIVLIFEDDFSD